MRMSCCSAHCSVASLSRQTRLFCAAFSSLRLGAEEVLYQMDSAPTILDETVVWQPDREVRAPSWPVPELLPAVLRGLACTCPTCGKTKLYRGYLKVVDTCAECGTPLGSVRADDAPPYFTISAVGHIVVPLMLMIDMHYDIADWIQAAFWVPVSGLLAMALLRPIKGATMGVMLRLGMVKADGND